MEVGTSHFAHVPSPKSHVTQGQICGISTIENMEIGTSHFAQVPGPKSNMDAYMATLLEARLGTCVDSWWSKKLDPTQVSRKYFCIELKRCHFDDN